MKRDSALWALVFAGASIAAALVMWGFTVDDALISIRYARHLAAGAGYRFNAHGPSTDGVTPLPWAFVLFPFAHAPALVVLSRVKMFGVVLHAAAAAMIGARASDAPLAGRITALAAFALCLPLAAYGPSGMETPLATLLCASCVFCMRSPISPVLAGLAASIRPELLPWAATISCGLALARRASPRAVIAAVLIAAAPFAACALARFFAFGHFAPLAVTAKPSDLSHGALYAIAAVIAAGVPLLLFAPLALRRAPREVKAIAVAFVVHVVAIAFAGGDWMPYARLIVPVIPTVIAAHVELSRTSRGAMFWVRSAIALALAAYIFVTAGPHGRNVMADRAELVARAEPLLRGRSHIASVDIGWVSAATEANIVDLAGLTDPDIAALAGGHTSKHVSGSMLLDRNVDAVVLWSLDASRDDAWGHAVAGHLVAYDRVFVSHYARSSELTLGGGPAGYVFFSRRALDEPADGEPQ